MNKDGWLSESRCPLPIAEPWEFVEQDVGPMGAHTINLEVLHAGIVWLQVAQDGSWNQMTSRLDDFVQCLSQSGKSLKICQRVSMNLSVENSRLDLSNIATIHVLNVTIRDAFVSSLHLLQQEVCTSKVASSHMLGNETFSRKEASKNSTFPKAITTESMSFAPASKSAPRVTKG